MWDGITYVDSSRNPIISEGKTAAKLVVTNVGPSTVRILGWPVTNPDPSATPDINVKLWPGNTISVSACLLRASIGEGPHLSPHVFAALGWRIVA